MFIDQSKDPGYAYLRVVVNRFPEIREMCKTASMAPEDFAALPASAYAWPEKRLYPIHNREHTALSVGYSKIASELPKHVKQTLSDAAELYDIPVYPEQVKVAAHVDYLLPEKQRFAVASAADVKEVEGAYHHKYAQLTLEDRTEAGYNLLKLAERYGVELSPSTQKLAGFTITDTQVLRDLIRARETAAIKVASPLAPVFSKLAEEFNGVEPYITDLSQQLKIAGLIHGLDKQAGLEHFYDKKLCDPMRSVFNTGVFPEQFTKVAGALQNKSLLQGLPLSFWKDALGDDIAKEIAPNGHVDIATLEQILPTLPADMKATLERQLAAYNK